eukprot:226818_1
MAPNYDQTTVSCHAKEEEAPRKGETATKRGRAIKKHIAKGKQCNSMDKLDNVLGSTITLNEMQSRQRNKPRETANKDRNQHVQNTGGITRRAFKAEEPNGPPKAEDLCGFHGDSMAMTKQFPLQSMIHLNEPIVKQREKEKHELRSETTRKEECLRNI